MVAVIRYRLSYPVQSERKEKQRPLTPVLTVHSRPARREVIVYANCPTLPSVFVSLNLHLTRFGRPPDWTFSSNSQLS